MNDLFKWETTLLKNDFDTKYSKFSVINRYFYSIIKEISIKTNSSKKVVRLMIKENSELLDRSLKETEEEVLKIAKPLLEKLNKHYKIYNKIYQKHYSECSPSERIGNLSPKDFKRISKTIFMQRYKNAEIDIKNSINSYRINIVNSVAEVTNPFFDVADTEKKFSKRTFKKINELQKSSSSFRGIVDKKIKELIKILNSNEIDIKSVEETEENLTKFKSDVIKMWISFKEEFQREIFKLEQTLLFNIIEANEYMDNKFSIVEDTRKHFPDIKKVYIDRIDVIKEKISLIEEKMGDIVPEPIKEKLKANFVKDLNISQSFSDDIVDVAVENIRRQFSDILNIIDYQVKSLNVIYTFFKSFQNNLREKNFIADGILSNLTVTFFSLSNRIKNKAVSDSEIAEVILQTLEMDLRTQKPKKNKKNAIRGVK